MGCDKAIGNNKKLLMGNEAIALGAVRAGVLVCTGYPGTPSTEILETIAREKPDGVYYEWSVNEKSAMEVAAGAAQSGARALVTMKQVGLNVASDPLMSLNYVGVKAGMVVVVADDPGPISSQTEQDTRHYGRFAKLCVFDPSTPEEAYLMAAEAFDLSERIGRPVILRPTTRVCHSYASVELLPDLPRTAPEGFTKDGGKWSIFPRLSYENKKIIEKNLKELASDSFGIAEGAPSNSSSSGTYSNSSSSGTYSPSSSSGLTRGSIPAPASSANRFGIASGGVSWLYVREALSELAAEATATSSALPECGLLKISTYPLPEKACLDFLKSLGDGGEVLVIEELDPFIEDELTRLAGRHNINVRIRGKRTGDSFVAGECSAAFAKNAIAGFLGVGVTNDAIVDKAEASPPPLPVRPPVLCAGCPHRGSFFAVKEAMKGKPATFSGDIGCYTLGNAMPLDMVDTCLCMGAGLTQAQGIAAASEMLRVNNASETPQTHFAFIGDSTFLHTGLPGLMNAAWNGADIVVCLLDNSTTAMTGGQPHPGMGLRLNGAPAKKISLPDIAAAAGADSVRRVNAFDLDSCKRAATEAAAEKGVRVIIFEGACINIVPKGKPLSVSEDSCTGCNVCVSKLGCPALSMGKLATIDPVLCTGCGLCAKVCPFDAIGNAAGGVTSVAKGGAKNE